MRFVVQTGCYCEVIYTEIMYQDGSLLAFLCTDIFPHNVGSILQSERGSSCSKGSDHCEA